MGEAKWSNLTTAPMPTMCDFNDTLRTMRPNKLTHAPFAAMIRRRYENLPHSDPCRCTSEELKAQGMFEVN